MVADSAIAHDLVLTPNFGSLEVVSPEKTSTNERLHQFSPSIGMGGWWQILRSHMTEVLVQIVCVLTRWYQGMNQW